MEQVKEHFENEAREFDNIILKLIPFYPEMIDALISVIPYEKSKTINVIDLGCGTGTISKHLKNVYPHSKITCIDIAENMLELAKEKLSDFSDIQFQLADFRNFEFTDSYDVVISSLAIHHLETNNDKKYFYSKIYNALRNNGLFFNADVVLGSSDNIQNTYLEKWKLFMKKYVSEEEIDTKWIPKYNEEDYPSRLLDQINWLREIGFSEVDIIWKYYNFSVYGGFKKSI